MKSSASGAALLANRILKHLPSGANALFESFMSQFYARVSVVDIEAIDPDQAIRIAESCFEFMEERPVGRQKIRVFVPPKSVFGWKSQRTVVEIINDDMPFLVDSISAELTRQGFTIHETLHPVVRVQRDSKGKLEAIYPLEDASHEGSIAESLMHLQISVLPENLTADGLAEVLDHVLDQVRVSVDDWQPIMHEVNSAIEELELAAAHFDKEEVAEVRDFLAWLRDRNFIFLGYMECALDKKSFHAVASSRLGILKLEDEEMPPRDLDALPTNTPSPASSRQLVTITKSSRKSSVHRLAHMDYVAVERFDKKGKVIGERRFLGLFTSTVYYQSAENIPIIRRKIVRLLQRARFSPVSHDGKALRAILEFYPRDEVLQLTEDDLFHFSMRILSLEARPAVGVLIRRDVFERYVSCMVFVPRERFSTYVREQIGKILEQTFHGTVTDFYTQMTDSPLARVQMVVRTEPGAPLEYNTRRIEDAITRVATPWSDSLLEMLTARFEELRAEQLFQQYQHAFPKTYINLHEAEQAVRDIEWLEEAKAADELRLELFRGRGEDETLIHLKLYNPKAAIPLSHILPTLERIGFKVLDENPFSVTRKDGAVLSIRDFRLSANDNTVVDLARGKELIEEALMQVARREIEDDGFNALVLRAQLPWRSVVMLRAYAKYLKQMVFAYSQNYIEQALAAHPAITRGIVDYFHAAFDPRLVHTNEETRERIKQDIEQALADVENLAEDRILRRYLALIDATWRTNFFQHDANGRHKPYVSFKFDSSRVPELPLPKPYAEIFVYSPRIEGIHLRGGKVARGGLRWSDRTEDFRTEVLGLMKAQMVKNAVIVPVGSKGGFVLKRPPRKGGREELLEEGVACYRIFLRGLLDITDNIVQGEVVPPTDVRRHDGDDPYLVVAADKGTATFSDTANAISAEYGFWLGDAFASGGSAGYDHKKMGITARGAWISVVRHFREMGVNIAKTPFSVVGIGDMSGDVFGNGMLLSDQIKLLGAFNHLHIFIDPNPDPRKSYEERKRLFALPRSTWKDYEAKLISKGGGVFERSAKSIKLSKEMREAFGIDVDQLTPDELIRRMLVSPVDLLWNGGIGTYVKSEEESDEEVGDRANNAVRVNGKDLRCRIVGEGGNLGFTQLGRIEYARAGGRMNTDAIDNSAGVDCSDHEVNIKIALGAAVASGKLNTELRNTLLESMTDEVASLVLKDNTLQTQAITIAELQGGKLLDAQVRLMHVLEKRGLLNRSVEFLPDDKALAELKAAKQGLTRPELAVLLAYSKMSLYQIILNSTLPDDPYFEHELFRYFPRAMQKPYTEEIAAHRLKREIIATAVTNSITNRAGITFLLSIAEDTGMSAADVASAYTVARDAFELRALWSEIEGLDATVPVETRIDMVVEINRFLERVIAWLLDHSSHPLNIAELIGELTPGIRELNTKFHDVISEPAEAAYQQTFKHFSEAGGAPADVSDKIARLEALSSACDIIRVKRSSELSLSVVGKVYFDIGARLQLGWLRASAAKLGVHSHWERLAVRSVVNDLYDQQSRLTSAVIETLCTDDACMTGVEQWVKANAQEIERFDRFLEDVHAAGKPDLSSLVVSTRQVKSLCTI